MTGPTGSDLVYLSTFDIDRDFLADYVGWFSSRHVPDLLGVGFVSVTGYLSHDRSGVCNLYTIPGVEVFDDAYQALAPTDPFRPRLAEHVHNGVRGVYRPTWSVGTLDAPPVLSLALPSGTAAGGPAPGASATARWAGDPAFLGATAGARVDAPVATDDAPPWRLLSAWAGPVPAAPFPLLHRLDAG